MNTPLLRTKLFIPPPRPELVSRPRLIERLDAGVRASGKLTLISAPAGFGKTTLISEWIHTVGKRRPLRDASDDVNLQVSWLSLDKSDDELTRFLTYLIAAVQIIEGDAGQGMLSMLQSQQPPPAEAVLTSLINEISAISDPAVLVLDDYHLIESQSIHDALGFLIEHLPPGTHVIVATREDPPLPLARLRARGQLTELRATDLRFTHSETATFLNQAMGLDLSAEDIAVLEARTEGWIAGLQLAAISMHGSRDATGFIQSFTGSHRYVLDYLIQEVLDQQPESIQTFLLRTSILDRLTGPLCDAVCSASCLGSLQEDGSTKISATGQQTLEALERAGLFIVPLDNERRWYRYHHLFADLLRQRLQQSIPSLASRSPQVGEITKAPSVQVERATGETVAELHVRASCWYEDNGFEMEAFHHAAAAHDIDRAARLMQGRGMPLQFRGAMVPVMNWLASLPKTVLDAKPSLWVAYASALTMSGQPISSVEAKLQAAEAVLPNVPQDTTSCPRSVDERDNAAQDLVGQIAAIRAMLAIPQNQAETMLAQSRRALAYLDPDNLPVRTTATWTLGYAHQLRGDRVAANRAYTDAIAASQASGNTMMAIAATTSLGQIKEAQNRLHLAAEHYRYGVQLAGDPPLPAGAETYLGLARLHYQWNDLDAAQQHAQQALRLAQQLATVDTPASCMALLARISLARDDRTGATEWLKQAEQFMSQRASVRGMAEIATEKVHYLLWPGASPLPDRLLEATEWVAQYDIPLALARVRLAQGNPEQALALLASLRQQAEALDLPDQRLKVAVLQALALDAHRDTEQALQMLSNAVSWAEPGGSIRIFVDEGLPMARLLRQLYHEKTAVEHVKRILAAFESMDCGQPAEGRLLPPSTAARGLQSSHETPYLVEPLSERELEVLQLIAEGLTNQEIATRLFLAVNTVKVHTRNIHGKLGVHSRTKAVAKARELGILKLS